MPATPTDPLSDLARDVCERSADLAGFLAGQGAELPGELRGRIANALRACRAELLAVEEEVGRASPAG
jgi:hypothetical protein